MKWFYNLSFRLWNETDYNMEQLDLIAKQFAKYFSFRTNSLQVEIDGMGIFSNQAIIHMKDVRDVVFIALMLLVILIGLAIFMFVLIYKERTKYNIYKQLLKSGVIAVIVMIIFC